jgi:hypothetical protein
MEVHDAQHHCFDRDGQRHLLRSGNDRLHEVGAMRGRMAAILSCLAVPLGPAVALEEPVIWRDTQTGCAYLLTPQGGIVARYRSDGSLDCPDVRAGSRVVDDTARGIAQGLDTLQRELERLKDRFNAPEPRKPPL